MNDKSGAWWEGKFGGTVTITKVDILNRGDCCGSRLNAAKVYVGDELCGQVNDPPQGSWYTINCKARGDHIKI